MFYTTNINGNSGFLGPDESRHCIKVLRKKGGDSIKITDGAGRLIEGVITKDDFRKCEFILKSQKMYTPENFLTHLAIAPTKNPGRMEFLVEKATEAGVSEISFIICEHSERRRLNLDRLEKVAISAMKQSGRYYLPQLNSLKDFQTFINEAPENQNKLIAFVDHSNDRFLLDAVKTGASNIILIGPEGDFSLNEVTQAEEKGFKKINMGRHVLRTETAALYAVISISALNNSKK